MRIKQQVDLVNQCLFTFERDAAFVSIISDDSVVLKVSTLVFLAYTWIDGFSLPVNMKVASKNEKLVTSGL